MFKGMMYYTCPCSEKFILTSVMSREAAAALICKLGCLIELLQSNALANVPTALKENTYNNEIMINCTGKIKIMGGGGAQNLPSNHKKLVNLSVC